MRTFFPKLSALSATLATDVDGTQVGASSTFGGCSPCLLPAIFAQKSDQGKLFLHFMQVMKNFKIFLTFIAVSQRSAYRITRNVTPQAGDTVSA